MLKAAIELRFSTQASPLGDILLVTDAQDRVRALDWHDYEPRLRRLLRLHYGASLDLRPGRVPETIATALDAYFDGSLAAPDALVCETAGTVFQRRVWAALRMIPAGQTTSYRKLAETIGHPKAVRAVGLANGANPIGIVVPCHRVIGIGGALTGYGGGLHRKRWLLAHEGALVV